jgi:hypothetical protein
VGAYPLLDYLALAMTNSRQDVGVALATYAALYNQRIGQFIWNILPVNTDIFFVEDDKLLELAAIYAVKYPPASRKGIA